MKEEIWKNIPNFEGYQVSNCGRVRTHDKTTFTKRHGERHWKDRILHYKGNSYKTGYRVDLWENNKPHTMLVARLVAFTFLKKDINDHELTVNHIDGNRLNNNIENLELISLEDNIKHAFCTGLMKFQIKIKLTNKKNNCTEIIRSMSEASKIIGHSKGYISAKTKQRIYENEDFKWEVLEKQF